MRLGLTAAALALAALQPVLALDDSGIPARPEDIEFDVFLPRRPTVGETRTTLPNGIPAYVIPGSSETLTIELFVRPISSEDSLAILRLACSAAVFGKAGQKPGAWLSVLNTLGASVNARMEGRLVVISMTAPARNAPEAVRALFNALESPPIAGPELGAALHAFILSRRFRDSTCCFGRCAFGADRAKLGSAESARRAAEISPDLLSTRMLCAAVSGGGTEKAAEALASTLGAIDWKPAPKPIPPSKPSTGEILLIDRPGPAASCEALFPAPVNPAGVPDAAFLVTMKIIQARLAARLRKACAVLDPVHPVNRIDQDGAGAAGFRFTMTEAVAAMAVTIILDETASLSAAYPTREEVFEAQESLRREHELRFESLRSSAGFLAAAECCRGAPLEESYLRNPVVGIGVDMVRQIAVQWMQAEQLAFRMTGQADLLEKLLGDHKATQYGIRLVRADRQ